jgi:hypothetical protein
LAGIPYVYVAELGGYELGKKRERKAPRMPNPAVPFSYLCYSVERNTPILPVFVTSPGADEASRQAHGDEFADDELTGLIRTVLLNDDSRPIQEVLRRKVLALVVKRAAAAKAGCTLTPEQWKAAYSRVQQGYSLTDYLVRESPLPWSKVAYIKGLTRTARDLMRIAATDAVGLTSRELPMCIVPAEKRAQFASLVSSLYGNLPAEFVRWLARKEHLAICWIMGFKPRGDDARPDRGLPALTRMLIGQRHDLLSVVYGPAPATTWGMLQRAPAALAQKNGLWEAILNISDAVLVDSKTDDVTNHGFLRSHWEVAESKPISRTVLVQPAPVRVGENDVDTVLHTLLVHHASNEVYEGMCNPPGGDWSGVSLQTADRSLEVRWLSLPRVSGKDTKRPDHVFQLFGIAAHPIILAVESKETAASVETRIGPRLSAYVSNLIASPPSIERAGQSTSWRHSNRRVNPADFLFASGVAFIPQSQSQIQSVIAKAHADLILAYTFHPKGTSCQIRSIPESRIGVIISDYLCRLNLGESGITVCAG